MTTRQGLKELQVAPIDLNNSAESFNATTDKSNSLYYGVIGYNSHKRARMSGHSVFVLDKDGNPLTSCKRSFRKWNKT